MASAGGQGSPQFPGGLAPPPPAANPSHQSGQQDANAANGSNNTLNNDWVCPGSFEELHKKCKDLMPQPFEGCKLLINKGLSSHFQVNHSIHLSSANNSSYHFGATYVGNKQLSPTEAFPVLVGDMDNNYNLNAQIIHEIVHGLRTKCVIQTQKAVWQMAQLGLDYRGKDFVASVTTANPNIIDESGVVAFHYLQSITRKLCLGAEYLYQYGGGMEGAVLSLGGRYTGKNWIAAATASGMNVNMTYYHIGNESVRAGVDLDVNLRTRESVVSLGYELDVQKANMTVKNSIDSNWTITSVIEKKLLPMPFTLTLSGILNHVSNKCQFGVGFIVG
ncbi:uncharacterized protein TRIADDRAFT_51380 [Trichoplax adhaerens]|uniref:Mitochondrial import receptor subunit TOM40 homolog n=1 Tax=Trichoplax adhaerens TaxID=10228 RepID=B3RIV2_TRIAD|nr:hypothetical protein TRIADDRAFT_51380 [Trichoplax adhaerens]EDV28451.1 hypothetical protein TRIADDRAFT_51380 [Trichoplax adhaerens]|eukprot:XP_002107653.1 hypothetical protein TRIADDRAFT_51380 [Trichoplax adhaerens]